MTDAVVLIASGPSLTDAQCQLVSEAQARGACHVLVVNDNWRRVPTADVLYAADRKWWEHYWPEVQTRFTGECWTQDRTIAQRFGLCWIQSKDGPGLSRDPEVIHTGRNSGYQAIGLAYHFGAKQIILVGYDMQREGGRADGMAHWFGNHPAGLANGNPVSWVKYFDGLAADLQAAGIRIVNCSASTALRWPRADLGLTLAAL